MRRRPPVALLAALLLTAGCATGPISPPPQSPRPATGATGERVNGLDLVFLTTMVAHTEQTLQIVRLGRDRASDEEIRTLAAAIEVTEADELATMRAWLRDAGPTATAGGHRHEHAGHADADLARLRAAPPAQADGVLLDVLSDHQQAAADLARAHLDVGASPRVRDLARRIERSRTAQVTLMAAMPAARR
ncbi:DUF305 domain-containing protein [Micromonospora phytophila]|uniref:DUF305 domain-containing protein n=1 Tax=Micromonospora phytophila TaxID=709888 RepID=UPI00202DD209|nr:DUF305 domain-containing protein [Micromonospora phytophila]MCM0677144.1 DUF305 domain-containing protein [Micromonospora phytophila]